MGERGQNTLEPWGQPQRPKAISRLHLLCEKAWLFLVLGEASSSLLPPSLPWEQKLKTQPLGSPQASEPSVAKVASDSRDFQEKKGADGSSFGHQSSGGNLSLGSSGQVKTGSIRHMPTACPEHQDCCCCVSAQPHCRLLFFSCPSHTSGQGQQSYMTSAAPGTQ